MIQERNSRRCDHSYSYNRPRETYREKLSWSERHKAILDSIALQSTIYKQRVERIPLKKEV